MADAGFDFARGTRVVDASNGFLRTPTAGLALGQPQVHTGSAERSGFRSRPR